MSAPGCRVRSPISIGDAVGDGVLKDFVALTKVHDDGWGVAAVDHGGDTPHVLVSAGSALDDRRSPQPPTTSRPSAASSIFAGPPAASPWSRRTPIRSSPTVWRWRTTAPSSRWACWTTSSNPAIAASLRGTTDSERYFAVIRQHRRAAPNLAEAVRRAVAQLRRIYPDASLNALILGEDQLIVVHAHARSRLVDEDIEEISATDLPAEHLEDYFALRSAPHRRRHLVVGSTGFGDLAWEPLPPECVIAISLRDMSMTRHPLGDGRADRMTTRAKDRGRARRRRLPDLSKAERRVGRALLADYPSAGLASAARLAERAEVSPPTVLRFAQSLGYDGFTDLQVALRAELTAQSSGPITRLPEAPAAGGLLDRLLQQARAPERPRHRDIGPASRLGAGGGGGAAVGSRSAAAISTAGASRTCLPCIWPRISNSCVLGCGCSPIPAGRDLGAMMELTRRDVVVLFDYHRYQRSVAGAGGQRASCRCHHLLITDDLACPVAPEAEVVLAASSTVGTVYQSMAAGFLLTELLIPLIMDAIGEPARTRMAWWEEQRRAELLP